jgi:hypothetical protein
MIPDRTNYEIWLIDYLDGNLDEDRVIQLFSFLEKNPDIKEEFDELTHYSVSPDNDSFNRKNILKKSISELSESQFEYLCVAASENDLSERQTAELGEIMAENQQKRKTFELIQKIKLTAPEVRYTNKYKLRKLTAAHRIIRFSVIGLGAAAAVTILITLFNLPHNSTPVFNSVLTAINSKASDSVVANPVKIAGNNNPDKKEEPNKAKLNIISSLQKTISDEMKSFNSGNPAAANRVLQPVVISKIDFKQNVNLGERSFSATLVEIQIPEINISRTDEKPGFNEFIARTFRKKILKSDDPEKGQLKAYEIADAGINGLNKLLGWQMSLQRNKDDKGDVRSVNFNSRLLKFNVPVKKVEPLP